jgi:hypothetical protein
MEHLIGGGRIADVILVALAAEVAVIGFFLWRRRETVALLSFVASSLAGGALVLALKAALTQASGLFVATYLLAALLAHAADIALRLRSIRNTGGLH